MQCRTKQQYKVSKHLWLFFLLPHSLLLPSSSFFAHPPEGAYKIEVDLGECLSYIYNGTVDTRLYLPANSTNPINGRRVDYCAVRTLLN